MSKIKIERVKIMAQHELDLDNFDKWIENKPPTKGK